MNIIFLHEEFPYADAKKLTDTHMLN